MTTDNKRDPDDVMRRWDSWMDGNDMPPPTDTELASALRDTLAERRIGESYLQHLRAKLDKAEAEIHHLRGRLSYYERVEPRNGHE